MSGLRFLKSEVRWTVFSLLREYLLQVLPSVPVQCPIRPIPHTVLTLPDGSELEERSVLEGTILLVSCGEGYELSNNNSNTNITCLATGKMSAEIPSCTEVIGGFHF